MWLLQLICAFLKSFTRLFQESNPDAQQRILKDTKHRFVLAYWKDCNFYPGRVSGLSETSNELISIYFLPFKKIFDIPSRYIFVYHNNLLNMHVSFNDCGAVRVGVVYGNNSPKYKGIPTWFYIRTENKKFVKVPINKVFMTKKQLLDVLLAYLKKNET